MKKKLNKKIKFSKKEFLVSTVTSLLIIIYSIFYFFSYQNKFNSYQSSVEYTFVLNVENPYIENKIYEGFISYLKKKIKYQELNYEISGKTISVNYGSVKITDLDKFEKKFKNFFDQNIKSFQKVFINELKIKINDYDKKIKKNILKDLEKFKGQIQINYYINYDVSLFELKQFFERNKIDGLIYLKNNNKKKYRKLGPTTLEYFSSVLVALIFINLLLFTFLNYIRQHFKK